MHGAQQHLWMHAYSLQKWIWTRACAPIQRCRSFFAMEAIANLSWVLREHRAGCLLPPALLLARRNQSPDAVRLKNPSKSTLAHDAVALRWCASIIRSSALVQASSSLSIGRTRAWQKSIFAIFRARDYGFACESLSSLLHSMGWQARRPCLNSRMHPRGRGLVSCLRVIKLQTLPNGAQWCMGLWPVRLWSLHTVTLLRGFYSSWESLLLVCVGVCSWQPCQLCLCVWTGWSSHRSPGWSQESSVECMRWCLVVPLHGWLMIAFITCNSNLVPLLDGLCSSNPCRFEVLSMGAVPQPGNLGLVCHFICHTAKLGVVTRLRRPLVARDLCLVMCRVDISCAACQDVVSWGLAGPNFLIYLFCAQAFQRKETRVHKKWGFQSRSRRSRVVLLVVGMTLLLMHTWLPPVPARYSSRVRKVSVDLVSCEFCFYVAIFRGKMESYRNIDKTVENPLDNAITLAK